MTLALWSKAAAVWFVIVMAAIANGGLRELALRPALGPARANALSGVLLSLLVLAAAWVAVPWFGNLTARAWWLVGLCWLGLTLAFEFGFGRLVRRQDWRTLLEAYRFHEGNLWPLVLLVTLIAPRLAAHWRGGP